MPAKSKAQQRFFGMVDALQKGEMKRSEASDSLKKAADSMSRKEVKKFAKTKTKGLPDHVDENRIKRIVRESLMNMLKESDDIDRNMKAVFVGGPLRGIVNEGFVEKFEHYTDMLDYYANMLQDMKGHVLSDGQRKDIEEAIAFLEDTDTGENKIAQEYIELGRRMLNQNLNENTTHEAQDETLYRVSEINVKNCGYQNVNGQAKKVNSFAMRDKETYTGTTLEEVIHDIASDYWCNPEKVRVIGNEVYMTSTYLKDANDQFLSDEEEADWYAGRSVAFMDTISFTIRKDVPVSGDEIMQAIAVNNN